MRQIKASEIKPGMTIEWSDLGIKCTCVVSSIEPSGNHMFQEIMASGGGEATLDNYAPVTVLSEPAPVQPEEPTWFGARVVVGGEKFLRAPRPDTDPLPWFSESDGKWRNWAAILAMGPVTVVPDQGWTVPDTPEVPDRIEEWPENDTALRPYRWKNNCGDFWVWVESKGVWELRSRIYAQRCAASTRPYPWHGPWTRVTDA